MPQYEPRPPTPPPSNSTHNASQHTQLLRGSIPPPENTIPLSFPGSAIPPSYAIFPLAHCLLSPIKRACESPSTRLPSPPVAPSEKLLWFRMKHTRQTISLVCLTIRYNGHLFSRRNPFPENALPSLFRRTELTARSEGTRVSQLPGWIWFQVHQQCLQVFLEYL
ncbi:hypothetical protein HanRHA438_Chr15g0716881 [Helianthus annuus]|nr:hypothetical protein HanRHA438_Chr15g0716881 [Helianthus annuus]